MIEKYSKTVSLVLRYCFADYVSENLPDSPPKNITNYINKFLASLPEFPLNGASEVNNFANDFYISLCDIFYQGKLSKNLAKQFYVCSILYSVLDNRQALIQERKCRLAAVGIRKICQRAESGEKYKPRLDPRLGEIIRSPKITEQTARYIDQNLLRAYKSISKGDKESTLKNLQYIISIWKT